MNIEIKFRVWDTKEKRFMVDGFEESLYLSLNHGLVFINTVGEPMEVEKERYVIQRYTELEDKNGKEIYEGDIVQKMIIGPVEYFLGEFSIGGVTPLKDFLIIPSDENQPLNFNLDLEIIGNIFENPELLK